MKIFKMFHTQNYIFHQIFFSIDTVDLGRVVKERKLMEKKVKIRTEYQDM